jgi:hypothetical protein
MAVKKRSPAAHRGGPALVTDSVLVPRPVSDSAPVQGPAAVIPRNASTAMWAAVALGQTTVI